MGFGTSFVKYVLFFFNLLFAMIGVAMIALGVSVLLDFKEVQDVVKENFTVAPWIFIIIGGGVFLVAFFGCCGAIRESHCMVVTYAICLLVIIIIQVALAVLVYTHGDSVRDALVKSVSAVFDRRTEDPGAATAFSNIETQLECCGKNSPGDYGIAGIVNLPRSCCPRGAGVIGRSLGDACTIADANKTGCTARVAEMYDKMKMLPSVAVGVTIVEIVGALFALCLANSIRNMDRRYA